MNINKFEEQLKRLFERHRPVIDTDAIWENIEPQLIREKKRRGFLWFFWGLGLGLLLLGVWTIGNPSQNAPNSSAELAQPEQIRSTAPFRNTAPGTPENSDNPADISNLFLGKNDASNRMPPGQAASRSYAPGCSNLTLKIEPMPPIPFTDQSSDADMRTANNNRSENSAIPPTSSTAEPAGLEMSLAVASIVPETTEATEPKLQEKPAASASADLQLSGPLKADKNPVENAEATDQTSAEKSKAKDKKRPTLLWLFFKINWEQQLSLQAGPTLSVRMLTARAGSADYLAARKSNERSLEAFSAALYYSAVSRKGFLVKTGLEYRQANEKFHRAYNTKERVQITGVLTQTQDASGAVIGQTTGQKTVTKTTNYSNTIYNHYRFLNLPIGLGYQHAGKKSRWELSAGVDFNLYFQASGAVSNALNQPIYLNAGDSYYDHIFRQKTGLGLWAAYGYSRQLTEKLRWQLAVQIQAPLSPVTPADYELEQRYVNFGVQAGVVYQIKAGKKGR